MKRIALTTILLASASFVACGGGNQPAEKHDLKALEKPSSAATPASNAGASSALNALLPAKDAVPGWTFSKAPRTFTADNLWELIDGAADGFISYGVEQVVTADYKQAGSNYEAVVEIYQMKDTLNAYGKYSEERNPDYEFLKVGNEGYSGGTSVNFWTGPYYVKITSFEEKEPIKQEMVKLAQAIAAKVSTPGAEPPEVAYFPKDNQVPHTTRYIPKDVLSQSYLTNGFEARYKTGGKKESKLVLVSADSEAAAQDALTRYRQYVTKAGKDVKDLAAPGQGGFTGKDSFYGNVAAVRAGKHIVVALGTPTDDAGRKQVAEMVEKIK